MPALVQHHLAEGKVVVDGRNQSSSARWKCRRARPLAALCIVIDLNLSAYEIGPIAGRKPVEFVTRHAETSVLHAERLEDAFSQERLQLLSRGARNQHAQHVGSSVIHPHFTRLVHEWKLSQAAYPLIWRRQRIRTWRSHSNLLLIRRLQDRIRHPLRGRGNRWRHHLSKAHAEGKQVTHRDRSVRRHRVIKPPVEALQHLALGKFGKQPIY